MPHMMPLMWMYMNISLMILMFFISSMIYFLYFPKISNYKSKSIYYNIWSWKW